MHPMHPQNQPVNVDGSKQAWQKQSNRQGEIPIKYHRVLHPYSTQRYRHEDTKAPPNIIIRPHHWYNGTSHFPVPKYLMYRLATF